jgi:serine/threonine protein kinase
VTSIFREQVQRALGDAHLLERELGGGGMSRVFLAHERALGRKVVVKVLLPELAAGVNVERFRREIQLAAQLQHPHIVPLLSAGEAEGLPYFIMPFVSGESLRTRISRQGEFPVPETLRILRDVISALGYAHSHGVIHRDVKPENVLLSGGVAVVTDFGVAKAVTASADSAGASGLTSLGVALGTPAYMAPEQATASPHTDHRADIYALGVVAYEMLTGFPPFSGRSAQAMLAAHVVEDPEPLERRRPSVPPVLASLVKGCLAKRPAERPQSAAELMHVLDSITTPSGGTAATTAVRLPVPVAEKNTRSRGALVAASLAVLALLAAGTVLWQGRPSGAEPTSADTSRTASLPQDNVAPIATQPAAQVPQADSLAAGVAPRQPPAERSGPSPTPARVRRPKPSQRNPAGTPVVPNVPDTFGSSSPVPEPELGLTTVSPAPPAPPSADPTPEPAPKPVEPPAAPKPVPEQPVDARRVIVAAVADYARAIESGNLEQLRRAYPGMTSVQQRGWEQFFQLVRDVKTELSVQQLDLAAGTAEAQINGTYLYLNTSTGRREHQPVAFRASFKNQGGAWRIVQVR